MVQEAAQSKPEKKCIYCTGTGIFQWDGTVYVYAALWTLNYLYLWIGDRENIEELKKEIDLYQNICDIMEKYHAQVVAKKMKKQICLSSTNHCFKKIRLLLMMMKNDDDDDDEK